MPAPRDGEPDWIAAKDNQFGMRILDCRPFTRTASAFSGNPAVAKTFLSGRKQDGGQRRGQIPTDSVAIKCRLRYTGIGNLCQGPAFRAQAMEEKWDLDFYDGKLYFSRSWTGDLCMVAETANDNGNLSIALIHSPIRCEREAISVIRDLDFLVKTYVFGRELPHCIPIDIPSSEKHIVTYSFMKFGRDAAFATYDDTLGLPV